MGRRGSEAAFQTPADTCGDTLQPEVWHHWQNEWLSGHGGHQSTAPCDIASLGHGTHGGEVGSLHRDPGKKRVKYWGTNSNLFSIKKNPERSCPSQLD